MNDTGLSGAATELHFLTIAQAARLIETRKLSPVELTQALLKRIDAIDPQLNLYITRTADVALERARGAEQEIMRGTYRGPMHGIPFALKDIFNTAGVRTTGHSKLCIDNVPREDAAAAARLNEAGAVLLGKVATSEFAHGAGPSFELPWPPARNPWNTEYFTGSSSSGSAAAVAAGLALGSMGSDTGGSIRIPASYCGVMGLKPTYGLISRYGVMPNSFTFDHCGPLTWTAEDCAIMLQATAGYDPRDPSSARRAVPDYRAALKADLRGMRVGVIRHFWEEDLPSLAHAGPPIDAALSVLSELGAKVETVRVRPLQDFFDVKIIIAESEIFAIHHKDLVERPQDFGANFLGQTLGGCLFQGTDYVQAQRERRRILDDMEGVYEKFDALITANPGPAPRLDAYQILGAWQRPNVCSVFNVTAGPAASSCIGFSPDGLPLSMQVAGRPFDDAKVLQIVHAYEHATSWRSKRPHLVAGAKAPAYTAQPHLAGAPEIDAATRARVDRFAEQSGLKLPEHMQEQLYAAAPYAFAMAKRIRRGYDRFEEPYGVSRAPGWEA